MQDIKSPSGDILIPANTPISLKVQPYGDGALLVAESIILNSQMIPINAISSVLPGRTITVRTAEEMARQGSKVYGNLANALGGVFDADIPDMQRGSFGGVAFGILKPRFRTSKCSIKKYIVLKSPKIIPGQEYFSFH